MRLMAILLVMLVIGFLAYKQLGGDANREAESMPAVQGTAVPKVPTNPAEVKKFEQEMNDFVKDEAVRQAQDIGKAESE